MEFLETENERLKEELKAALEEIQALREENLQLKNQLKDPNAKIKQVVSAHQESTFITKGAESPTVACENW
jgi:regulator of replication initiation timing